MTVPADPADVASVQAITRVVHCCARALDRLDRPLLLACFHADATDEHPPFYGGTARGFVDWVLPALAGMLATRHQVSNVLVALAGDAAGVESYWSATLRVRAGDGVQVIRREGRYLDRFTRREGVWAIAHRHSITEWHRTDSDGGDPASLPLPRPATARTAASAARDRSDPSYAILEPSVP